MQRLEKWRRWLCTVCSLLFVLGKPTETGTGQSLRLNPPVVQHEEHGAFVTTLGRDTVAVEDFGWSDRRLTGNAVLVTPQVIHTRFTVTFDSDRRPQLAVFERRVMNDTLPPILDSIVLGRDSVRVVRRRIRVREGMEPSPGEVFLEELYLWSMYEFQTRAMASVADSTTFATVSMGSAKAHAVVFRRRAPDTLSTMFFYPEYWMSYVVAPDGKLLGIDGSRTTIKVTATRQPAFAWEPFLATAAQRELAGRGLANLSPFDSVTAAIGSVQAAVAYSRPALRGRRVWGGAVVPWNVVWRTGANSATRLHLSGAVRIGGRAIPAGSYTIFSLPTSTGATLIINKQVGQWGTEYDQARDLARIPVTVTGIRPPVEQLTIRFAGKERAQALILEWGDTRWAVPIGQVPE